jgi:hypothetical protein
MGAISMLCHHRLLLRSELTTLLLLYFPVCWEWLYSDRECVRNRNGQMLLNEPWLPYKCVYTECDKCCC